jgi:hypothetical protein
MEPGRAVSLPQRIWTVDICTRFAAPAAVCHTCGPLPRSPDRALRTAVLRHLARHARRDVTPPHLRTCQCGRRGCPWHGRTRGCSGPILLALVRSPSAGTWRLADLCHQCAVTTPHTAPVPHHTPPAAASHSLPSATSRADAEDEQLAVWESVCPSCHVQDGTCQGGCLPHADGT